MPKKVRKLRIDSIQINKEFLKKLGLILEREIKERDELFKKKIENEKNEFEVRIKRQIMCKYSVKYTIVSNDEELEFTSMDELVATSVFPQKIKSMTFRVTQKHHNYVDISFSLDNDYDSIAKLSLSSEDESRILKIEKNVKDLFKEYRTRYNWIFSIPASKYFILQMFTAILTVLGTRAFLKLGVYLIPTITKNAIDYTMYGIVILLLICFNYLLKYLYPYYSFEMSSRTNLRSRIKYVFYTLFLALVASAAYDLSKLI